MMFFNTAVVIWALWASSPQGPVIRAMFYTQKSCEETRKVIATLARRPDPAPVTSCLPGGYVMPQPPVDKRVPL
jgi:hypothetical protein